MAGRQAVLPTPAPISSGGQPVSIAEGSLVRGLGAATLCILACTSTQAAGAPVVDRTILPIQEPARPLQGNRRAQRQGAAALRGQGTGRGPERGDRADRRHGLRRAGRLRRAGLDADAGHPGPAGSALQQLPHHGAVLTDPRCAEVRAQSPHGEHGVHHRDGHRLAGRHRADPERDCATGRDAATQRLCHGGLRQVARDGGLGSERRRSVRSLAHPPGLRQVLRLHRRRDEPVGAVPVRRYGRRRTAQRPELPLHGRHDGQGRGVDQVPEGAHAAEAVVHLLRAGRDACAAPRAAGVDRALEGPLRPGLGQAARGIAGPADQHGHRAAGHQARAEATSDPRLGHALGRREAPLHAPGRGVCCLRGIHRPRDRPHARRRSRTSARPTTRSLSTSPATMAPAAKAVRTACSTSTRTSTACRRPLRRCCRSSTSGAGPRRIRTWRPAGRSGSMRRSAG